MGDINVALNDHLAEDIIVIDLKGKSDIADYMVIATGRSGRQVSTMADRLIEVTKLHGIKGISPEGKNQGDWILIDVGDIIIHLFRPEVRQFYNLEKMWQVNIPNIEPPTKL